MKNKYFTKLIFFIFICFCPILIGNLISCGFFDPLNPYARFIHWAKSYGDSNIDEVKSIITVPGDSCVAAGYTSSFGINSEDGWIIKLDNLGEISWEKAFGTNGQERINSICYTNDNCIISAGTTGQSDDTENRNIWIMKNSMEGTIAWEKYIGWAKYETAMSIDNTPDGGYIAAGSTTSHGTGEGDAILIKLTSAGDVSWIKLYAGELYDDACVVESTHDQGIVFGGNTCSAGAGNSDFWVVKTNGSGEMEWGKAYGNRGEDHLCFLAQTSDNGFILGGASTTTDSISIAENWSYWIIKTDESGLIEWHKAIPCSTGISEIQNEFAFSLCINETENSNFVIAATIPTTGGNGLDFLILKCDEDGNLLWQNSYGGKEADYVFDIEQSGDNGYMVAGKTNSFGVERSDSWILKLMPTGDCPPLNIETSIHVQNITCAMTPIKASVQEIPIINSGEIMFRSTVTTTYSTVRQQAP